MVCVLTLMVGLLLITNCRPTRPGPVGRPLKGSDLAIYRLMEDGQLRHIKNWSTYLSLGYQAEDIIAVTDDKLAAYPLGLPLNQWVASPNDPTLYFLHDQIRYRTPNLATLQASGGDALEVSLLNDNFIRRFPIAEKTLPNLQGSGNDRPHHTAAIWHQGRLWLADSTGGVTRWTPENGAKETYLFPGQPTIHTLLGTGSSLLVGTAGSGLWRLNPATRPQRLTAGENGWITALSLDQNQAIWYADSNHYDFSRPGYRLGHGLVWLAENQDPNVLTVSTKAGLPHDPARAITALQFDSNTGILWAGTRFAGLIGYQPATEAWQHYHRRNSDIAADAVNDVALATDGALWLATASSVSRYDKGVWENEAVPAGVTQKGALSLAISQDGAVWVAGDQFIARRTPATGWQIHTAIEQPLLADRFRFVMLNEADQPWFVGDQHLIHFDGRQWRVYDSDLEPVSVLRFMEPPVTGVEPPPLQFPSPHHDYQAWLQTWPRPANDNGRGMHFVQNLWVDEAEAQEQIERLTELGVRWVLVNYANHYQLKRLAPLFSEADLMVVWRPFVRPYESYPHWQADVEFLRTWGLPPYLQLYNEPSLAQEWDNGQPIDQAGYLQQLLPAIEAVYEAGGYVGLQFIDPTWLRLTLQTAKTEKMEYIVDRLFFIPHLYGINHPPDYDEDINGVLGFREFAKVFEAEIGFVPVMITGEGGWRPGEALDNRYPPISETMHRDYHLAVFDWFRNRRLSNGEPLPDYLFVFSAWLISDPQDPAAWYDSDAGDRTLTIEAVQSLPSFTRKFSWEANPN